jgi:hypothetical protein
MKIRLFSDVCAIHGSAVLSDGWIWEIHGFAEDWTDSFVFSHATLGSS